MLKKHQVCNNTDRHASSASSLPGVKGLSGVPVLLLLLLLLCWPVTKVQAQSAGDVITPVKVDAEDQDKPAADAYAKYQKLIDQAVETLTKEAEGLEEINQNPRPNFKRPHPLVANWGPEMSLAIYARMTKPFTKNEYRDTYIRWHLLWAAKQTRPEDRQQTKSRLTWLMREMPYTLDVEFRQVVKFDPPEAYLAYSRALNSLRVLKGYPPFQVLVGPPESLPLLGGNAQARWAEVQVLETKFTRTVFPDAIAYNRVAMEMKWVIRQYRGEMIYAMMQLGDINLMRPVFKEIDRQARRRTEVAFDLMAYLYLGSFDGLLNLYQPQELQELSQLLEGTARATDRYVEMGPVQRNFADYAFHMIYMLRNSAGFALQDHAREALSRTGTRVRYSDTKRISKKITSQNLTVEDIDQGVDAAIKALYEMEPPYAITPNRITANRFLPNQQEVRYLVGNHALANWALLASGESYQSPEMYRRVNWVLSSDVAQTYDRSLRMQMLAELPRTRWGEWIRRDKNWLVNAITFQGNYDYAWYNESNRGPGDNANGQYGVLGLWGAERNGESLKLDVWRKIDEYWRKAQKPLPEGADPRSPSGWSILTFDPSAQTTSGRPVSDGLRVSGPMTAGGVAVLSLTERYLYGEKMSNTQSMRAQLPQLGRGVRWLDENFAVNDTSEQSNRYYYFWTMQRVGHVTGYRTFNNVDWYREITASLLNEQTSDGTWDSEQGRLLSTGFSLLYLGKANDPLAISKIRVKPAQVTSTVGKNDLIDAAWNTNPHDIWNFVDYISDLYENR